MAVALVRTATDQQTQHFTASSDRVQLQTQKPLQLIDLTELVAERVRRARVQIGSASLQVLHTTAALLVNENEPLLLTDLERALERLMPRRRRYAHDRLAQRLTPAAPTERRNGHAHCKGLLLAPSVTLHVVEGQLLLGRWQRLFLVELDGPRLRELSVVTLGLGAAEAAWR